MTTNEKPAMPVAGQTGKSGSQWFPIVQGKTNHLSEILQRLHGVREVPSGFVALCPAHDDRNPSLSIRETEDKILLRCFADCPVERIVAAIGLSLSDLFLDSEPGRRVSRIRPARSRLPDPSPRRVGTRNWRKTAAFEFHDEAGKVVAIKRRYDFTAVYADGSESEEKEFKVYPYGLALPLYNLPAVLSAVRQGWPVWLVEGERKADTLNTLIREEWGVNVVATSYGGHWRRDLAATLTGAKVIVIPDTDEAGKEIAERVIRDLSHVTPTIACCDISDMLTALEVTESVE